MAFKITIWGIVVICASVAIGSFFGSLAMAIYGYDETSPGDITGGSFGLVYGLLYVFWIIFIHRKFQSQSYFVKAAIYSGILAGILCSTSLHLVLVKITRTYYFSNILAGGLCAIIPAWILAWISATVFWRMVRGETNSEKASGESCG